MKRKGESFLFVTHPVIIIHLLREKDLHIMKKREKLSRQWMNYTQLIGKKEGGEHLHIHNSSQTQWYPKTLLCA